VFALGVILFNIVTGKGPFDEATKHDPQYFKVATSNPAFWDNVHNGQQLSAPLKELILSMI
jgi:hypothetical protein